MAVKPIYTTAFLASLFLCPGVQGIAQTVTIDTSVTNGAVSYINETDVFSPDFYVVTGSNVKDWAIY